MHAEAMATDSWRTIGVRRIRDSGQAELRAEAGAVGTGAPRERSRSVATDRAADKLDCNICYVRTSTELRNCGTVLPLAYPCRDLKPNDVNEAPSPIPAEGAWTGNPADLPNWDMMPRRNRRRRRRGSYPIWLKYFGWCVGFAVLVTAAQIAVHAVRSDPRDARVFADRELRLSVLRPNERVLAQVSVWQRPAIDYFRPTRGLFVVTDAPGDSAHPVGGRLIYVGLQPRDPLSPPDAPPTFDERDWPIDTAVVVSPTRTLAYLSRALRVQSARDGITMGVPSPASADADRILHEIGKKYSLLRAEGWRRREARRARDRAAQIAWFQGRREWYYTVRRGDALASVARMFNTTPEQIQALNGLVGNTIKIGEKLKVKGWTTKPTPTPANGVPEFEP